MSDYQLLDVRTVERNIKAGKVTREDYQKHIENLEDCAEMGEPTETEMILHCKDDEEEAEA
jgi:tellurite resistance protein